MTTDTLKVLRWAHDVAKKDPTVQMFWGRLCEAVSEPETASAETIYREVREYGGNTIANVFRDSPIPYSEVAGDVASGLDGFFGDGDFIEGDVESCEEFVLRKMEVDAASLRALCDAVRGSAMKRAAQDATVKASSKAVGYGVARRVAAEAARRLAARTAAETGKRVAQRVAAQLAARIVAALNVIFAAWAVIDLAGPAMRVTIPAVTYIALLRRLHEGAHDVDLAELRKAVGA